MNREDLLHGEWEVYNKEKIQHLPRDFGENTESLMFWEFGMGCGMKSLGFFYIPFLCLIVS